MVKNDLSSITRAGLPLVTSVKIAGFLNRALRRHRGSELGPLQLGYIGRIARTLADKEEWIVVASPGVEGAEGHGHSGPNLHVQDAEVCRLRPADAQTNK